MVRYLQITFLPHMEKGWNFFIWLTDENGMPLPFPEPDEEKVPGWLSSNSPYRFFARRAEFAGEQKNFYVSGALMTMPSVFRLIRNKVCGSDADGIRPGRTFQWLGRIADALQLLLEDGHVYPYFYHLKRGNEDVCYYCQWMPENRLLVESGLFVGWLSTLPHLSFAMNELQDEKTRQWLYLLIIYWTGELVRSAAPVEPVSQAETNGRADSEEEAETKLQKGQPLGCSGTPWLTVRDSESVKKANDLEMELTAWVHPVADSRYHAWTHALMDDKKAQMARHFSPELIQILLNPSDEDDPFSADAVWESEVVIGGRQNGERIKQTLENFLALSPIGNSIWLDNKINRLTGHVPDQVMNLLNLKAHRLLSARRFSDLLACRKELESAGIVLTLSDDLEIDEEESQISISLDIHPAEPEGHSLFTLTSLINYNWRISVGEINLSAEEFQRLVKENQSFIRRGDRWIHLPISKMARAYAEMGDAMHLFQGKPDVSGALRLNTINRKKKNPAIKIHVASELENYLNKIINKPSKSIAVPSGFTGELRPYQKRGFTWLANLRRQQVGGCLADDMGLGKTVQAIAYLDYCRSLPVGKLPPGRIPGPSLVICPTSLVANWEHEFSTFSSELRLYIHHGASRLRGDKLLRQLGECDVMITSYAIFTKEAEYLNPVFWKSVILDEAQAIKNPHAQKTQALRKVACAHRLVLTGTPIENHLEELWSIMDFLNPGYLDSLEQFRRQFVRPVEKKNSRSKMRELTRIIQPFILRREKTDKRIIRDLPDKFEAKKTCFLSKDQASLYQNVVNKLARSVTAAAGIQRKGLILSALTKLKQICDHPALLAGEEGEEKKSGKMDLFFSLLDPLFMHHEKVLVFTQYVKMGKLLVQKAQKRYPDADVFFLYGGLNAEQRTSLIQRFQADNHRKTLFILSLKAGGLGINLTKAGYVFHYDRWWNPAVEEQATDRAYRIGQERNVHVYKLICEGTLEERIDLLIDRKKNLQRQILGGSDAWLTEMSDSELFDLIKLRKGVS
jgi:Superfamily II DNA/RNA helicases, SNF2 family